VAIFHVPSTRWAVTVSLPAAAAVTTRLMRKTSTNEIITDWFTVSPTPLDPGGGVEPTVGGDDARGAAEQHGVALAHCSARGRRRR